MYDIKLVQSEYREKTVAAEFAASLVKSNMRMHFGIGAGTSVYMDRALGERIAAEDNLGGLVIHTEIAIRNNDFETAEKSTGPDQVRFHSAHFSSRDRKMRKKGNTWYVPILFNETNLYWGLEDNVFDICCIQVAPMDKYGNFNFGPVNADLLGILKNSKTVIVEVNEKMPIALGYESHINISNVDYIIEGESPALAEMPAKPASPEDIQIARFIVEKVRNDSTIQLGIGGLPNTVGKMLADSDIHDLSAHSEMFVDAYMHLYYAGKLTGNKKLDKGLAVYTFAGGSKELYDFIDDNPICCSAPVDYVNDIHTISQLDNFISVNSCIEVDLYGQVCSESVGYNHISGTGGQLDFVQGAFRSQNGKSFICTHSARVDKSGKMHSLINPILAPGSIVTTPRAATHYIVTEYGMANLKGKSTWQRAEMLINISHPKFRDDMIKEAEKMGIWSNTSRTAYD